MACGNITEGYTRGCSTFTGGVLKVAAGNYSASTVWDGVNADGTISGSSNNNSTHYIYEQKEATCEATQNMVVGANGATTWEQSVTVKFFPVNQANRNKAEELKNAQCTFIVYHQNGEKFLFGETNALEVSAGEANPGIAQEDDNVISVTMVGKQPTAAREIDLDGTYNTTLIT